MTSKRIASLRDVLREKNLDGFVVTALHNIRYLSGFSGTNAALILTHTQAYFLTDSRYAQQIGEEVKGYHRVVTVRGLFETAAQKNLLRGCERVGFEAHYLPYAQYRSLKRLFHGQSFIGTSELVEGLSLVKDRQEIALIKKAAGISDRVFNGILKIVKPGVQEADVAAEISYLHRRLGADRDAFEPIVASGVRGAFPHAGATAKKLKNGEMVTMDFGCTCKGYNSDITRTIGIGRIPARAKEIYDTVRTAQQDAVNHARGGIRAKDLDGVARRRIKERGYGRYFVHSLGHGLGLRVHERPRVSTLSKEVLRAGSVITIEPGVYIPGFGGVRIEDDVLLTEKSCEVLNTSTKDLVII
jgi:Xaa-Pro aminopeptidase